MEFPPAAKLRHLPPCPGFLIPYLANPNSLWGLNGLFITFSTVFTLIVLPRSYIASSSRAKTASGPVIKIHYTIGFVRAKGEKEGKFHVTF